MSKSAYIYILTSAPHGTLYIGVTSNLAGRVWQHKSDVVDGFTKNYDVHRLVHYEVFDEITQAIAREKQLKNWKRDWKVELIEEKNPDWVDLYPSLF